MNKLFKRIKGGLLIVIGLFLITVILLARPGIKPSPITYGVSFSAPHATGIGLDWRNTYNAILNDLNVKKLRLSAYWNQVEPQDNQYNFDDLDYQMNQAAEHNATVILSIGRKLPRWPECHQPDWAAELSEAEQQAKTLELLPVVIERYKNHAALNMWQLENEPLLNFGECPPEDLAFLKQEETLLRELDPKHPILITDSGELNSWIPASQYGDMVGTTMYRTVFSKRTQKLFHYDYIFPAWLYRAKARLVKITSGKDVLISELQGEPWGVKPYTSMSQEERRAILSPERFLELYNFSARTALPEAYWWGAEYWYWEKEVNNEPVFWELAKTTFDR